MVPIRASRLASLLAALKHELEGSYQELDRADNLTALTMDLRFRPGVRPPAPTQGAVRPTRGTDLSR